MKTLLTASTCFLGKNQENKIVETYKIEKEFCWDMHVTAINNSIKQLNSSR